MKKVLLSLFSLALFVTAGHSQSIRLGLEARGGFKIDSDPHFYADNITFIAAGTIDEHFSYTWKQRFTRPFIGPQPLNGTDALYMTYATGDWQFSLGKQTLECGGLEYDAPPIDLHFTTECYNNITCYVLGASVARTFGEYKLIAQVCRSPFALLDDSRMNSLLGFNLALHSNYGKFWVPHYSLNFLAVAPGSYSFQFTLGNRFEVTKWLALEWDVINRSKPGSINLFKDYSMVFYSSIRPKDWLEFMVKATLDKNNLWDDPLAPIGTDIWKIGTGAYFFPTKDRRSVRFHYYLYHWSGKTCFELGLTLKPTLLNLDFKKK